MMVETDSIGEIKFVLMRFQNAIIGVVNFEVFKFHGFCGCLVFTKLNHDTIIAQGIKISVDP